MTRRVRRRPLLTWDRRYADSRPAGLRILAGVTWSDLDRPPLSAARLRRDLAENGFDVRIVARTASTNADLVVEAVTGAAECLISLEMDYEGARAFASEMFALGPGEASHDEITDVVGELTNMVGGNIKSLLPEPSVLSLPVVGTGIQPPSLRIVGGSPLLDVHFVTGAHPLHLTVWRRPSSS